MPARQQWITKQWCRTCGRERPKSTRFCPHDHDALDFLPGFVDAQTNRLQHVLRDLEKYGIPALLGADEWAAYKGYTLRQYYEPWLRFFQRAPGKVLACVGDVAGTPCPYKLRVDMGADVAILRQQLEFLQMDHSVPKHAICTQWKRAVARWWAEHGGTCPFTFRCAVDIDFVNYLLFSIEPDARWGPPMVRPRCYLSAHHCNCHKAELEHCRMIGLSDFAQLNLDPLGVHEVDEMNSAGDAAAAAVATPMEVVDLTGDDDGDAMQKEDIIDLTDDADSMELVEDVAMDAVERVCGLLSAVALGGSLGGSAGGSVGVGRAVHAIINPE